MITLRKSFVLSIFTVFTLLLSACGSNVELPVVTDGVKSESGSPLYLETDESGVEAQAVKVHPLCYVAANNPHSSNHAPGQVNTEGRTYCLQGKKAYMRAGVQLHLRTGRSYTFIDDGVNTKSGVTQVTAFANGRCRDQGHYYAYMEGYLTDGGRRYSGTDTNDRVVTCGRP